MIKFKQELSKIKPYVPGKPIEEVKRELNIEGEILKLASNENPFGISPKAMDVIKASLNDISMYPDDSSFYLKKDIADMYNCSESNVLIGNGSVELLHMLVYSIMGKNDFLLRSEFAFIMSLISPKISGADVINIGMKDFRHDIDEIVKQSRNNNAKIIYIDNPANPIGTMLNQSEIEYLIANISDDRLIILDEAYDEYLIPGERVKSVELLKKHNNIAVLSTFSKIYGLAGLRIGFMIADAGIVENVAKVRLPFNVNILAQKAARAALMDQEFIDYCRKENENGKKYINNELISMKFDPIPSFTNFITFDTGRDGIDVFKALQKKGIIIRPLANYGLKSFIRVSIGTSKQNEAFIKALREVLNEV